MFVLKDISLVYYKADFEGYYFITMLKCNILQLIVVAFYQTGYILEIIKEKKYTDLDFFRCRNHMFVFLKLSGVTVQQGVSLPHHSTNGLTFWK